MYNYKDEIKRFLDKLLENRLALLTKSQRQKYNRIFPKKPVGKKLDQALDLIDRTLNKDIRNGIDVTLNSLRINGHNPKRVYASNGSTTVICTICAGSFDNECKQ